MALDVYQFPDKKIPDGEKDAEWHRQYILAIMTQTLGGGWFSLATTAMDENYNFYQSLNAGEEFEFLQESEDGQALPAIWINFNKIRTKVHLMLGELIQKGYEVSVQAINKEAQTRKMRFKAKVASQMRMKEINRELANISGIEFSEEEFMPESMEELETFVQRRYKDNHSMIIETALRYNLELYKWKYKRFHAFRDMIITGRLFGKNEIRNGYPNMRIIDPRLVVFDPYSTDDFLSDASYFGEIRYMSFEDAAEQYNVDLEELEELYTNYNTNLLKLYWQGATSIGAGFQTYLPFTEINGGTRVLVFEAEWLDYKEVKYKVSKDKFGNEHYKMVGDDATGNNIVNKLVATVRRGALVGGHLIKHWGEAPNQTRSLDNPSVTRLNYKCLLPNYVNYKSVSKVDEMKSIQKLKDVVMYKLQLDVITAGKKGFFYDVATLPDDYEFEEILYYMKTVGIGLYDSRKEGIPMGGTPLHEYDQSLSTSVSQYLTLAQYLDTEMDIVSGINEARMGQASASSLVGVVQQNQLQSSFMTEQYYDLFFQWEERMLQSHADLIKMTWGEDREKFAPIMGELGLNWIDQDLDADLDDYAVFIKSNPPLYEDRNLLHEMTMNALQSGGIGMEDAVILLSEKDYKIGIRKFLTLMDRKRRAEAMQAEEQRAHEFQMAQMADQQERSKVAEEQGHITQREMGIEQIKAQRDGQRTQVKEQSKLQDQREKRNMQLLLKEMEMFIKKQEGRL
jgi:hypothetical protein